MILIASLTTIPDRERGCFRCVKSLLKVRPRFQKIVVTIPKTFLRMEKVYPTKAIRKLKGLGKRVEVRRIDMDLGPGTKYLGFGKGSNEFTFICDDDKTYPSHLIRALVKRMKSTKRNLGVYPIVLNSKKRNNHVRGMNGLLCPPGSIEGYEEFLKILPKQALEIDDDTFEVFLKEKKVHIVHLKRFRRWSPIFTNHLSPHALSGNRKRRQIAKAKFQEFLKSHPLLLCPFEHTLSESHSSHIHQSTSFESPESTSTLLLLPPVLPLIESIDRSRQ